MTLECPQPDTAAIEQANRLYDQLMKEGKQPPWILHQPPLQNPEIQYFYKESAEEVFGIVPTENPIHLDPAAKQYKCMYCTTTHLEVFWTDCYRTFVRCPICKHEALIHEG